MLREKEAFPWVEYLIKSKNSHILWAAFAAWRISSSPEPVSQSSIYASAREYEASVIRYPDSSHSLRRQRSTMSTISSCSPMVPSSRHSAYSRRVSIDAVPWRPEGKLPMELSDSEELVAAPVGNAECVSDTVYPLLDNRYSNAIEPSLSHLLDTGVAARSQVESDMVHRAQGKSHVESIKERQFHDSYMGFAVEGRERSVSLESDVTLLNAHYRQLELSCNPGAGAASSSLTAGVREEELCSTVEIFPHSDTAQGLGHSRESDATLLASAGAAVSSHSGLRVTKLTLEIPPDSPDGNLEPRAILSERTATTNGEDARGNGTPSTTVSPSAARVRLTVDIPPDTPGRETAAEDDAATACATPPVTDEHSFLTHYPYPRSMLVTPMATPKHLSSLPRVISLLPPPSPHGGLLYSKLLDHGFSTFPSSSSSSQQVPNNPSSASSSHYQLVLGQNAASSSSSRRVSSNSLQIPSREMSPKAASSPFSYPAFTVIESPCGRSSTVKGTTFPGFVENSSLPESPNVAETPQEDIEEEDIEDIEEEEEPTPALEPDPLPAATPSTRSPKAPKSPKASYPVMLPSSGIVAADGSVKHRRLKPGAKEMRVSKAKRWSNFLERQRVSQSMQNADRKMQLERQCREFERKKTELEEELKVRTTELECAKRMTKRLSKEKRTSAWQCKRNEEEAESIRHQFDELRSECQKARKERAAESLKFEECRKSLGSMEAELHACQQLCEKVITDRSLSGSCTTPVPLALCSQLRSLTASLHTPPQKQASQASEGRATPARNIRPASLSSNPSQAEFQQNAPRVAPPMVSPAFVPLTRGPSGLSSSKLVTPLAANSGLRSTSKSTAQSAFTPSQRSTLTTSRSSAIGTHSMSKLSDGKNTEDNRAPGAASPAACHMMRSGSPPVAARSRSPRTPVPHELSLKRIPRMISPSSTPHFPGYLVPSLLSGSTVRHRSPQLRSATQLMTPLITLNPNPNPFPCTLSRVGSNVGHTYGATTPAPSCSQVQNNAPARPSIGYARGANQGRPTVTQTTAECAKLEDGESPRVGVRTPVALAPEGCPKRNGFGSFLISQSTPMLTHMAGAPQLSRCSFPSQSRLSFVGNTFSK